MAGLVLFAGPVTAEALVGVLDLGDIASVWTLEAFLGAAAAGFGFGIVLALLSDRRVWRPDLPPAVHGWLVGLIAAAYLLLEAGSQVAASLIAGDPLWSRILSRAFPYLAGAIATGAGVWAGLAWRERRARRRHVSARKGTSR